MEEHKLDITLAHIGINASTPEESLRIARFFARAFNLPLKAGNSSNFAGSIIEVMKQPYLGTHGHIALASSDPEAAMEILRTRGLEFDLETAKYKDGKLTAIYLKEEFGGFAVHLLRRS